MSEERFVFASPGAIRRQAVNWKTQAAVGGNYQRKLYTDRSVRTSVRTLEKLGLIVRAERTRGGRRLRGWVVPLHQTPPHEQICSVLTSRFSALPSDFPVLTSGLISGLTSGLEGPDFRSDCRSDEAEVLQPQQVGSGGLEVLPEVLPSRVFKNPLEPIKRSLFEPVRCANLRGPTCVDKSEQPGPEKAKAKTKPVFELAVPRRSLDGFGLVVAHYADEGMSDLQAITVASVEKCQGLGIPTPADPAAAVQTILRRSR